MEILKEKETTYLILEVRGYTEASFLSHFLQAAAAPVDSTLSHKIANRQNYQREKPEYQHNHEAEQEEHWMTLVLNVCDNFNIAVVAASPYGATETKSLSNMVV